MAKKPGRKPKPVKSLRTFVVTINLTRAEHEAATRAADGRPLGAWLRLRALTGIV